MLFFYSNLRYMHDKVKIFQNFTYLMICTKFFLKAFLGNNLYNRQTISCLFNLQPFLRKNNWDLYFPPKGPNSHATDPLMCCMGHCAVLSLISQTVRTCVWAETVMTRIPNSQTTKKYFLYSVVFSLGLELYNLSVCFVTEKDLI